MCHLTDSLVSVVFAFIDSSQMYIINLIIIACNCKIKVNLFCENIIKLRCGDILSRCGSV